MVSIASKATQFILMGGFMLALMDSPIFLWIAIVIFGIVALFSIVTLPVEYDASNRALAWMKESHVVTQDEYVGAKDALKWAARTYLVAALAAVANVLYFALRLVNSRD
jgi:Zn-dependent membrane protease YugP